MTVIQDVTQASEASTGTSSLVQSTDDIMGKEDFLTLLVAQLKNQDPLNPDDPTEFTAQLAQFSSLEQLFNLNESMDGLVTANANSDKLSTLQTIGKDVTFQENSFEFEGNPMDLGYQLDGSVTEVQLAVQQNGSTVRVLSGTELEAGNHFITWDGLTETGQQAAEGSYKLVVHTKTSDGESITASPLLKAEVTGVDLEGDFGGTLLTRAGDIGFNKILGVYDIERSTDNTSETTQDDTNI